MERMDLQASLSDRGRPTRVLLAALLGVVALRSLRSGKRLRGVLAGSGAVALGYSAATDAEDVVESLPEDATPEPTSESVRLRCESCGEPIVPGQPRRPNEDDDTVHEACLEASA
jgi:hypothetical protein